MKHWRSGPQSGSPGEVELRRLYVDEQLSYRALAGRFGVTTTTVGRWLRAAGIEPRSISEGNKLAGNAGVHSEAHREALRRGAAKARAKITPESRLKQGATRRARKISAPNKGKPASEETKAKLRAQRSTPEYREAQASRQRGALSRNWKGGVTAAETRRMQGWEWRQARQKVYERDNFVCQDCGCKCLAKQASKLDPKRRIQAHHIIRRRDGGTDDLSNLVTLCASCHMRREARYSGALFA